MSVFFGGFWVPLVIYLIKKDESPVIRDHSKEALNFQLNVLICCVPCFALACVGIGIFLLMGLMVANMVFGIIAAIKASDGELYSYPCFHRFVK